MQKENGARIITPEKIEEYAGFLREQERSPATILKYVHDLTVVSERFLSTGLTKPALIQWKIELESKYAASSVNTMLASLNGFLDWRGWGDLKVKPLKIQRSFFSNAEKELTIEEYERLVRAAHASGNERLSLIIQTIGSTGIRVSELKFISVQAVEDGKAEISNKGKRRTVFLPRELRKKLKKYLKSQKITAGAVFVTRTGKPIDRSNIWRDMKNMCRCAGVDPKKVFPHNLRHLFARTYYSLEKDMSRLADILGHSNINTTRIYTMESGTVHARQVERLGLVLTT